MNKLTAFTDVNALVAALIPSDYVDAHVLAASTAETFTKPTGARFVRLKGTVNFFFKPNGTAAVPAADVTDGTSSTLVISNNEGVLLNVEFTTTISVIASAIGTVVAEWWA